MRQQCTGIYGCAESTPAGTTAFDRCLCDEESRLWRRYCHALRGNDFGERTEPVAFWVKSFSYLNLVNRIDRLSESRERRRDTLSAISDRGMVLDNDYVVVRRKTAEQPFLTQKRFNEQVLSVRLFFMYGTSIKREMTD